MFYYLLLAHLLADYPLQSTWMVNNKDRWGVVIIHACIQFLTSFILVLVFNSAVAATIWPYLLVLALVHFLIDSIKTVVIRYRPNWVKILYILDQLVHIFSIFVISLSMQYRHGVVAFPANPGWVVLVIAYLIVTYVWYISEKVMTQSDSPYREAVVNESLSRMIFRAGFLSVFLGIWVWTSKSLVVSTIIAFYPYQTKKFGRRALITDLGVTFGVFLLLILVLNPSI